MFRIGDLEINKMCLGNFEVVKAYLGEIEVYGSSGPTPPPTPTGDPVNFIPTEFDGRAVFYNDLTGEYINLGSDWSFGEDEHGAYVTNNGNSGMYSLGIVPDASMNYDIKFMYSNPDGRQFFGNSSEYDDTENTFRFFFYDFMCFDLGADGEFNRIGLENANYLDKLNYIRMSNYYLFDLISGKKIRTNVMAGNGEQKSSYPNLDYLYVGTDAESNAATFKIYGISVIPVDGPLPSTRYDVVPSIYTYTGDKQYVFDGTNWNVKNNLGGYEVYGVYGEYIDDRETVYEGKMSRVPSYIEKYQYTVESDTWSENGEVSPFNTPIYKSNIEGQHGKSAVAYIDIILNEDTEFVLYAKSNGEARYDYLKVYNIDSEDSVKKDYYYEQSTDFVEINYGVVRAGAHRIKLVYTKDSSDSKFEDAAFFYLKNVVVNGKEDFIYRDGSWQSLGIEHDNIPVKFYQEIGTPSDFYHVSTFAELNNIPTDRKYSGLKCICDDTRNVYELQDNEEFTLFDIDSTYNFLCGLERNDLPRFRTANCNENTRLVCKLGGMQSMGEYVRIGFNSMYVELLPNNIHQIVCEIKCGEYTNTITLPYNRNDDFEVELTNSRCVLNGNIIDFEPQSVYDNSLSIDCVECVGKIYYIKLFEGDDLVHDFRAGYATNSFVDIVGDCTFEGKIIGVKYGEVNSENYPCIQAYNIDAYAPNNDDVINFNIGNPLNIDFEISSDMKHWKPYTNETIPLKYSDRIYFRSGVEIESLYSAPQQRTSFNIQKTYSYSIRSILSGNANWLLGNPNKSVLTSNAMRNIFMSSDNKDTIYDASGFVLQAENAGDNCYTGMFDNCRNLHFGPCILTKNLGNNCCFEMFDRTQSLQEVTCYSETFGTDATKHWIYGSSFKPTTSGGYFYKKRGVEWSIGDSGIPDNWTVVEVD